jgi:hypothetical protein
MTLSNRIITFFCFTISTTVAQGDLGNSSHSDEKHESSLIENSVTLSIGGVYSFSLEGIGINTRAYYNIGETICFGPEFSYFRKHDEQILDFNLIGHYIIDTKFIGIYPLAGVNYTIETDDHHKENSIGVVFGAGIHRNLGRLTIFTEYSHVQGRISDDFLAVGLMININ